MSGDLEGARRAWEQALTLPMSAHERASLLEHRSLLDGSGHVKNVGREP
jgi:hypothetical protein